MQDARFPATPDPPSAPRRGRVQYGHAGEGKSNIASGSVAGHIHAIIGALGEDPNRAGLRETPERVARAFEFLTDGTTAYPYELIRSSRTHAMNREMVLVRDVEFYALCERYLMPFFGRAHVALLPNNSTVETSTIVRLIAVLVRRLQTQERLTRQIGHTIEEALAPRGVAVLLEARHTAVHMQGPEKQHAVQLTHTSNGAFLEPENQAELNRLLRRHSDT